MLFMWVRGLEPQPDELLRWLGICMNRCLERIKGLALSLNRTKKFPTERVFTHLVYLFGLFSSKNRVSLLIIHIAFH